MVFVQPRPSNLQAEWSPLGCIAFSAYLCCKSLLSLESWRDISELRGFKNDNTKISRHATFILLSIAHNLPTRLEIL